MVTDLKKVLMRVANKTYAILDIEPFYRPGVTRVNLAKADCGDELVYEAGFDFPADLLATITDDDLERYLTIQINRVFNGEQAQNIKIRK